MARQQVGTQQGDQRQRAQRRWRRAGPSSATALILAMASGVLFIAGFVFIGFYVYSVNGPHLRFLGAGFLTASAAFVVGCLVGLVVGIPRFVSSGALRHDMEARRAVARKGAAPPAAAPSADVAADDQFSPVPSSQLTPSTNLAEISDWLTKLLLGAGLVELTRLGRPLSTLVNSVARAMQDVAPGAKLPASSVVVAAGILAMYVVLGFLDGYVVTTVWYGKYLERLDYS